MKNLYEVELSDGMIVDKQIVLIDIKGDLHNIYKIFSMICQPTKERTISNTTIGGNSLIYTIYDGVKNSYYTVVEEENNLLLDKNSKEYIMSNLFNKALYVKDNYDYNIGAIFLQGSQNYGLSINDDNYQSDIDAKLIVLPSLDDLINKNEVNKVVIMPDGSHVECKDIRLFKDLWKKSNTTYLELLCTEYKHVFNCKIKEILKYDASSIIHMHERSFLNSIRGTQQNKLKQLTHPYPNCIEEINEIGYSKKQFHHIYRLYLLIKYIYLDDILYYDALKPTKQDKELLLHYKCNAIPKEEAMSLAQEWCNELNGLVETILASALGINERTYASLCNSINLCIKQNILEGK